MEREIKKLEVIRTAFGFDVKMTSYLEIGVNEYTY